MLVWIRELDYSIVNINILASGVESVGGCRSEKYVGSDREFGYEVWKELSFIKGVLVLYFFKGIFRVFFFEGDKES